MYFFIQGATTYGRESSDEFIEIDVVATFYIKLCKEAIT